MGTHGIWNLLPTSAHLCDLLVLVSMAAPTLTANNATSADNRRSVSSIQVQALNENVIGIVAELRGRLLGTILSTALFGERSSHQSGFCA